MKQGVFTIESNVALTPQVWQMRLRGDTGAITRPGQFADVHIDGARLAHITVAPDVAEQPIPGERHTRVGQKQPQQFKFF